MVDLIFKRKTRENTISVKANSVLVVIIDGIATTCTFLRTIQKKYYEKYTNYENYLR